MKILMVCLGNICRSPLAEGILKHKIEERNLPWEVDSAGTSSWHKGELPDSRSIEIARKKGIDISDQRSRPFHKRDFQDFDQIYVMDRSNLHNVLAMTKSEAEQAKVRLILDELHPGGQHEVPDPYFGTFGFENVFNMLDEACEIIVTKG